MFGKFFNKENSGKSPMEQILSTAKFMGFDIPKMIEDKIPEIVSQAKEAERKAGCELFITIALDEEKQHFVLSLWKYDADVSGVIRSYKLTNLETLISQIQHDLNNITDDTIKLEVEQLTISSPEPTDNNSGANTNTANS